MVRAAYIPECLDGPRETLRSADCAADIKHRGGGAHEGFQGPLQLLSLHESNPDISEVYVLEGMYVKRDIYIHLQTSVWYNAR